MLYATFNRQRSYGLETLATILWKDLRTSRGYLKRAQRAKLVGMLQVYRSEHAQHPYGNDKLVAEYHLTK